VVGPELGLLIGQKQSVSKREKKEGKWMMEVLRKLGIKVLLLVMAMLTHNATAALTSSYHEGSLSYATEQDLMGHISFAVFDTSDPANMQEYEASGLDEIPGARKYIYAYQIFSTGSVDQGDLAHFAVLDIDGNPIDESVIKDTSAQDDDAGGIAPSPIVSETQGLWKWTAEGGYIAQGEHSWLLVFSSNEVWTEGTYEILGPQENEFPVPVPEPGTLALLGLGIITIATKRKRTVQ
jgi:hypothetical protein